MMSPTAGSISGPAKRPSEIMDQRIRSLRPSSYGQLPVRDPATARSLDEALFDARAQFKVTTSRVSMHLGREWRSRLFRQLDSLLDTAEWDSADEPPREASFMTFLRMLLILKPAVRPGLGASPDGHLIAAWTAGDNRLTIHCLPDDAVNWVLTRHIDGDVERAAGTARIARLRDVLAAYRPEIWFGDAQ